MYRRPVPKVEAPTTDSNGLTLAVVFVVIAAIVVILWYTNSHKNDSADPPSKHVHFANPPDSQNTPAPKMPIPPTTEHPQQVPEAPVWSGGRAFGTGPGYAPFGEESEGGIGSTQPAQSMIILPPESFDQTVLNPRFNGVVAFVSNGCGACQAMKPAYMEAATYAKTPMMMVECSGPNAQGVMAKMNIGAFPTIARFEGGQRVQEYNGDRSAQSLAEFAR